MGQTAIPSLGACRLSYPVPWTSPRDPGCVNGSVVQDPTLPPGNLIMIYEAEIHCPPSSKGMGAGWVSIGVTRSADGGRTWPPPVAQKGFEQDWLEYGNGRYAGLTLPGTPPRTVANEFFGNVLPSAFVDDRDG